MNGSILKVKWNIPASLKCQINSSASYLKKMNKIINLAVAKIRLYLRKYNCRKTNHFVKDYYKLNKRIPIEFEHNIWSKNFYWDFFYHSLPHAEKSRYFVPYDYYSSVIEPALNDRRYSAFISMKNMYDRVYGNLEVKLPKTLLRCMNNIYMDAEYNLVPDARELIRSIKQDVIVKAASDSYGGYSVRKYILRDDILTDKKSLAPFDLDTLNKAYKGSFLIQAVVKQHPELARFHPYSLNTIRVMTYRSVKTNEVVIPMAMLRMGVDQSVVDNASSNGIAVAIDENGFLNNMAFNQFGKCFETHPTTNLKFEGSRVPNFNMIRSVAIRLSNLVPYQRIVGWDFSIDADGDPVLIELNIGTGTWMYQIVTGKPLFGIYSNEVKEYIDSL